MEPNGKVDSNLRNPKCLMLTHSIEIWGSPNQRVLPCEFSFKKHQAMKEFRFSLGVFLQFFHVSFL